MNKKTYIEEISKYTKSQGLGKNYLVIKRDITIPKNLQNIKCDGSSIWSNTKNKVAKVTSVEVDFHIYNSDINSDEYYIQVYANHNLSWPIYTDKGFEKGLSEILSKVLGFKVKVFFTEQGMQRDGVASLENASSDKNAWKLAAWVFEKHRRN